jgi:hypothetical protein
MSIESPRTLEIKALPRDPKLLRRSVLEVSRALGVPVAATRALLEKVPIRLPGPTSQAARDALADALTAAQTDVVEIPLPRARDACGAHPQLDADERCERCGAPTCALCVATIGGRTCRACVDRDRKSSTFFRVRVAILLSVLAVVSLYAAARTLRNQLRTTWTRPVTAAFVVVRDGPVDDKALAALRARIPALEATLSRERHRYVVTDDRPFTLTMIGPTAASAAPAEPTSDAWIELAAYTFRRWRWTRAIDDALGLDGDAYDARIYLVARSPKGRATFVEGLSEQGGRVGVVGCDLDASTVDWSLSVAAHELFHTLGATDKYDAAGHARVPEGLPDPKQTPLYPQKSAEIMTLGVAASATNERALATLDELRVGTMTAAEIGWVAALPSK